MKAQDIYNQAIRPLPAGERLRLATLILNDIPMESIVDYSEEWRDDDYRDFSRAGWDRIREALGEAEDA